MPYLDEPEAAIVVGLAAHLTPMVPARKVPCHSCDREVWLSWVWPVGTKAVCGYCVPADAKVGMAEAVREELKRLGWTDEKIEEIRKEAQQELEKGRLGDRLYRDGGT